MVIEKLEDIANVTAGTSPKGELINSDGIGLPFFQGSKEFGELVPRPERYTEHPVRTASEGDVLVGVRAPVGKVNLSPFDCAIGRGVMAVTPKNQSDGKFLFYFLRYLEGKWDSLGSTGSIFENLSASVLRSVEIPENLNRAKIGEVLYDLDLKIENNKLLAQNLESTAQRIFRSWFIDFDPVKAKIAGDAPVGMDAETAALFPDSMEESELGEIPKGWSSVSVKDLCSQLSNGSTPKRSNEAYWSEPIIDWYKTGELRDNFLLHASEGISQQGIDGSSVRVLPAGSVLMAIYAAPTVGRLGILTEESVFNQACTGLVPKPEVGTPFLYLTLKNLRGFFINRSNGAAQQNISKQIVEAAPCVSPPLEILKGFNEICGPIFELWESLTKENAILAQTRDSLLPRLISGELKIPDELLAA